VFPLPPKESAPPPAVEYDPAMEMGMTRIRRTWRGLLGAAAVAALLAGLTTGLSAHHGWGGYDTAEAELTGTVEAAVSTAGPHATMKIRVKDQVWDVVLAPPARTMAAGLKEGVIPVGATVTVHGHKHRDTKKLEIKTERVTWNGKLFNVYPDRT
jgi:hypothetical protein